jgi:hypothetical protein
VNAYNGAPALGHPDFDWDLARDIAVMPDGAGYVVLTGIGTVHKYGSAADPATLGPLGFPYSPGNDQSRSIAVTPDGQGYLVLLANGTISKWAARRRGACGASEPGLQRRRRAQHCGDARRRRLSGARPSRRSRQARQRHQGLIGVANTPYFGIDVARYRAPRPRGYYLVDSWGGLWGSQLMPAQQSRSVLFADAGAVTIIGGQPVALRNDGTTVTGVAP